MAAYKANMKQNIPSIDNVGHLIFESSLNKMFNNSRKNHRQYLLHHLKISIVLILQFLLINCSNPPITYYDSISYHQLTSLKAEIVYLVKSFDKLTVEQNTINIEKARLHLLIAYEYELGKGEENSVTVNQLKLIIDLFEEDVQDYMEDGPQVLGVEYFLEASSVIGQAFDIAIVTEYKKNRPIIQGI